MVIKNIKTNKIKYLAAVLAGLLMPFAFAPYHLFPLAILSLTGLLYLLNDKTVKESFLLAFLFGLGYFGYGVWWVYISIHVFGHSPWFVGVLFTGLFVSLLAFFPALVGYLYSKLWPGKSTAKILFIFPALWTLSEFLRSKIFTGFPWLSLGYSQLNSPLSGFAPFVSVYGVSFAVALSAALVFLCITSNAHKKIFLSSLVSLWIVGFLFQQYTFYKPAGPALSVSMVQGNVSQWVKWDPEKLQENINVYRKLTTPLLGEDLIVWPEASIPAPLWYVSDTVSLLNTLAKKANSNLILGIEDEDDDNQSYNAMLALGNTQGIYHKRHLVPFGEYLPLSQWLRGVINFFNLPSSDLVSGKLKQANFTIKSEELAPFICYEIAYPGLVRHSLPKANILTTISDDSWFGDSIALYQHLEIAQMRALETARPLLFSSNSGVTALVDPRGNVLKEIPIEKPMVLSTTVQPMTGETPFVRFGELPILLLCVIIALVGTIGHYKYIRNPPK